MRSERRKLREVQNVISIIIDEDMRKIYLGYLFLELGSLELYVYTICTRENIENTCHREQNATVGVPLLAGGKD